MARSSISARIHPTLDAKIKQHKRKLEAFLGIKISYIKASQSLTRNIKQ
jgi:hypothetical protein